MAKKLGTDKPILTSPLDAILDPNVAAVWRGDSRVIQTASGELIDLADVQAQAMADGVMEHFYRFDQQSAMKLATRRRNKGEGLIGKTTAFAKRMEAEAREIPQVWMSAIQQRMRMALYLEYRIQRGASRKVAKKAVDEALYDWSHGVSLQELKSIAKISAFYRYQRLAFNQTANLYAEMLSEPPTLKKTLFGMDPYKRLRAMSIYQKEVPAAWMADYKEEDTYNDFEQKQAVVRQMAPWYLMLEPRGVMPPALMSDAERQRYDDLGFDFTHYVRPLIGIGPTDSAAMFTELVAATYALPKILAGGDVPEGYIEDFIFERFLGTLAPVAKEAAQGASNAFLGTDFRATREYVNLTPAQAALYEQYIQDGVHPLGLMGAAVGYGQVFRDENTGRLKWPGPVAVLNKHLPFVGPQLVHYVEGYYGVPEDTETRERLIRLGAAYFGLAEKPMNVEKDWSYSAEEGLGRVESTRKEALGSVTRGREAETRRLRQKAKEREADND
jgi:hypothetical protein